MTDVVDKWCFGDATIVSDTLRIVPLKLQNGPITMTTEECYSPFDLSSPQEDANRKNLVLRLSETWESKIECMEANIMYWVSKDPERYFTEALGEEEIQERFKSSLHKKGEYPAIYKIIYNIYQNIYTEYTNNIKYIQNIYKTVGGDWRARPGARRQGPARRHAPGPGPGPPASHRRLLCIYLVYSSNCTTRR